MIMYIAHEKKSAQVYYPYVIIDVRVRPKSSSKRFFFFFSCYISHCQRRQMFFFLTVTQRKRVCAMYTRTHVIHKNWCAALQDILPIYAVYYYCCVYLHSSAWDFIIKSVHVNNERNEGKNNMKKQKTDAHVSYHTLYVRIYKYISTAAVVNSLLAECVHILILILYYYYLNAHQLAYIIINHHHHRRRMVIIRS
jgi:hypothetical protein